MNAIWCRSVHKVFGTGARKVTALENICLDIAAGEPHLTVDDVEQFVLGVVAVQRGAKVLGPQELHRGELPVGLLAVDLRGVQRVEEVEVPALVAGNHPGTLCGHDAGIFAPLLMAVIASFIAASWSVGPFAIMNSS